MHFEGRLRRVVFGTARATVKLGKKLHLKVRRTDGEPQSSLFLKIPQNSPTYGREPKRARATRPQVGEF